MNQEYMKYNHCFYYDFLKIFYFDLIILDKLDRLNKKYKFNLECDTLKINYKNKKYRILIIYS